MSSAKYVGLENMQRCSAESTNCQLCMRVQKPADYATDQEDALRRLFDLYDLDKNGAIDLDELIQGLGENRDFSADSYVPAEVLQKIMDTVDKDANRQLDYEEFRNLFTEAFETS